MSDHGQDSKISSKFKAERGTPSPFLHGVISDEALFFGGSFAIFGLGLFFGARGLMKREKFILGFRSEYIGLATRALMYGTALSVGTVGVGTLVYMRVSGINTPKEFARMAREKMSGIESIKPGEEIAKDIELKNSMSNEEEMSYWYKLFFSPRSADENVKSQIEERMVHNMQESEERNKGLSFWDRHFNRPPEPGTEKRQSLWQKWTSKTDLDKPQEAQLQKQPEATSVSVPIDRGFTEPEFPEEKARPSLWTKNVSNRKN
jgi:hypothetical protein